ncbi:hypothetical protein LXA43DRAFT_852455, partial [Ganoderma leucocontextum]
VLALLTPLDVLQFARVSRSLQATVKSLSRAQWEGIRNHVPGLLPCPPWMSEAQYASLCFESHCHSCIETNVGSAGNVWEFGVRYCSGCR